MNVTKAGLHMYTADCGRRITDISNGTRIGKQDEKSYEAQRRGKEMVVWRWRDERRREWVSGKRGGC